MLDNITTLSVNNSLDLDALFNADERAHKINLSGRVYKDETGNTPILECVRKAEAFLLENRTNKRYLPISGLAEFNLATQSLLLGSDTSRAITIQTLGGRGALQLMAALFASGGQVKRVWVNEVNSACHSNIFQHAGIEVCTYHDYSHADMSLDFSAMLNDLSKASKGDAVLFQACCQSPTGTYLTLEQWQIIADLAQRDGWLPLFEVAYQGLASDLEDDLCGLSLFTNSVPELLIATSYSNNLALYNERIGALTLVTANAEIASHVATQINTFLKTKEHVLPAHGANIVAHILTNAELKEEWLDELKKVRDRLFRLRQLFVKTLQEKGGNSEYAFINKQKGLFAFLNLNNPQINALREQHGIYIDDAGLINLSCMTIDNMSFICESLLSVRQNQL